MTVMFPRFFGIPQSAIRSGKVKELSGSALKLYVALCHDSERHCTRELTRDTTQLQELVGGCRNSHAKARAELVKAGLVRAELYGTEGYVFHLCDPETGKPLPIPPKQKMTYRPQNSPLAPTADVPADPAKLLPPKIDFAGTEFPFGANAPAAKSSTRDSVVTPKKVDLGKIW